jgi:hypothetical protein
MTANEIIFAIFLFDAIFAFIVRQSELYRDGD